MSWIRDLPNHAERIYSQGGEDGVLRRIFDQIGVTKRFFVEFGAWDGIHLSNSAHLRIDCGWTGLLLEGSDRADGALVKREHVDAGNIEGLFDRYAVPAEFDLLSIDIDGNDYWVWNAINAYSPRVVIVEYNVFFRPDMAKTIAYDAGHEWDKEKYGLYHGASLAAFEKLARKKGYALVYTESYCPNAIFVRRDLIEADADVPTLNEFNRWDWPKADYREPTPAPGGRWVDV